MMHPRREVLKLQAAAVAAAAAGIGPAAAQPLSGGIGSLQIAWSKAPCRFCGTGCGVMVGVRDGKVVATHGDVKAEVNRGLNCVKGYFLSKRSEEHTSELPSLMRTSYAVVCLKEKIRQQD